MMKDREPRMSVFLTARMRTDQGWSDVCIQNISAHGMLLKLAHPVTPGAYVEVRHSIYTMIARAVWVKDRLVGVRTQDPIDVNALLQTVTGALGRRTGLYPKQAERRRDPARLEAMRRHAAADHYRRIGLLVQYCSTILFVLAAASIAAAAVIDRLGAAIATVKAHLAN